MLAGITHATWTTLSSQTNQIRNQKADRCNEQVHGQGTCLHRRCWREGKEDEAAKEKTHSPCFCHRMLICNILLCSLLSVALGRSMYCLEGEAEGRLFHLPLSGHCSLWESALQQLPPRSATCKNLSNSRVPGKLALQSRAPSQSRMFSRHIERCMHQWPMASVVLASHSGAAWPIFSITLFTWKHRLWICLSQAGSVSRAARKKKNRAIAVGLQRIKCFIETSLNY